MAVNLSPLAGAGAQFFTDNGVPLAGGLLYVYNAGTTTPLTTYTSSSGNTANANPIVLDAAGRVPEEIWLLNGYSAKFVLKTSADVQIWSKDNIPASEQPPISNDAASVSYDYGYSVTAGSFIVGETYKITSVGTTNFLSIGATSNTVGTYFIATGVGSGTGTADFIRSVQEKLQETVSVKDFGAIGNGIADDKVAIQAALTAAASSGKRVYVPAGDYYISSTVIIYSDTEIYGDGVSSRIFGSGTYNILNASFPAANIVVDSLYLDGGKTSGTADVVVCFYASASTATPSTLNSNITVRNCKIAYASAGIGVENGTNINFHDNTISHMYRHATGTYAGVYGYGIVFNGCTQSIASSNTIGVTGGLIQRHGIYMPVFRDSGVVPSVLVFCSNMRVIGNNISVDDSIDPFASCVESWSYFDTLIANNVLLGGIRGVNTAVEYQNGTRVTIANNIIKDSTVGIRCDKATYGATPSTYYIEEYLITGNTIVPKTSVVHQAVFLQGVKKITFTSNYCKGDASTSFAFGYYDLVNNIVADSIISANNTITGFQQGFYLANVLYFVDDKTSFSSFTSTPIPYNRISAISTNEMWPIFTPQTELYIYSGVNWSGVSYYSATLQRQIKYNGTHWVDQNNFRAYGTTALRPNNVSSSAGIANQMAVSLPYGFAYYDTGVGAVIYWNGNSWFTSLQPASPISGTTAELNTFASTYPNALLAYNAVSWNTSTSKTVFWNALTLKWVYADGTNI